MSIVPYWSGIQYSGYRRLGALALGYAAKYGAVAAAGRMALGKRKRPRRRRFERSKFLRTQKTYQIAKRAVEAGKELKFHQNINNADTVIPIPNDGGTAINEPVNNIPRGVATTERVGNEVSLERLTVRMSINRNTNVLSQAVRFVIFTIKRPNARTINNSDYFSGNANTLFPKQFTDWYNGRTLFDRTYQLDANSGRPSQQHIKVSVNLRGMRTRWQSNNTNGTIIETGGLYMVWIGDTGVIADMPSVAYTTMLTYKDR